ncbi:MAG: hypothetical protein ABIH20_06010 [Candidatus Diapherotrites archaeon]
MRKPKLTIAGVAGKIKMRSKARANLQKRAEQDAAAVYGFGSVKGGESNRKRIGARREAWLKSKERLVPAFEIDSVELKRLQSESKSARTKENKRLTGIRRKRRKTKQ